ncbi:MAG: ATP-binding cassette domain-containing protein [Propionibacteriaceae bacterium]|jgi:ABC-type multidrug transport system ATPase subunit|nr:ATP-binding cassette domain-containing protein [Propionibacteriaceae bacterium]
MNDTPTPTTPDDGGPDPTATPAAEPTDIPPATTSPVAPTVKAAGGPSPVEPTDIPLQSSTADPAAGDSWPAPETPGIAVTGLKRAFGEVRAVDGVTFIAPAGAVTALVGPNGSGKTTLLLMLAGLLRPDAGEAFIAGHDVVSANLDARSAVGWMPDTFGTWDTLTCHEILTLFAQAYGIAQADAAERASVLLERLYLDEFADRPARVLSRGQKQRLGLARALVHDPDVLLLDEPASGLDPRSRIELRDTLRDLAREGKTVLVSSHVLSELDEIADHAVFLSRGRTVETLPSDTETSREWRLEALDPTALRRFLDDQGIAWRDGSGTGALGDVVISSDGYDPILQLIRAAVEADLPLHTVAPATGRLEATYLSLDEERK